MADQAQLQGLKELNMQNTGHKDTNKYAYRTYMTPCFDRKRPCFDSKTGVTQVLVVYYIEPSF